MSLKVGAQQGPKARATRNRPTLSCVYCHRRKQRCNRGLPCSNCILRGVPDECYYESKRDPKLTPKSLGSGLNIKQQETRPTVKTSFTRPLGFRPSKKWIYKDGFPGSTEDDWGDSSNYGSSSSESTQSSDALSRLGAFSIDPFRTLPVDSSPRVDGLLYHFQEVVGPGLSSMDEPLVSNPFKNSWMPYMVSSPALFYATLYSAAVHRDAMFQTGTQQDSLIYKSQTINKINEDLRGCVGNISDGTIAASMAIMYTECSLGDTESIQNHQNGLREMVRLRGGIQNLALDGLLANLLTTSDRLAAVLTETLPVIYIPPSYSIGPPLNPNTQLNMDSPISPHSRNLSQHYTSLSISKTTAVLLDDMRSLTVSLLTRLHKDPDLKTSTALRHAFLPYQTELMAMTSESDPTDDSYRGDYIYECCRLTAIIYVRSILHGIPFSQSYPKLGLQKLDRAIKKVSMNGWNRCPGVLLWVLLVQLPARRLQENLSYYLGMSQKIGAAVGFVAWDDLIKSIECFIRIQQFVAVR